VIAADVKHLYVQRLGATSPGAIKKSNGAIDTAFKAPTDGNVCAVQSAGGNLSIGGGFGRIGGVYHPNLGAVAQP
jgi:hypothetical protein